MSSHRTLDTLPSEIQLQIFSQITAHDLSTIARTSKRLNEIVTPLLWTDIELHEDGYHESRHELKVPPPARDPARRPYHPKQKWGNGQGARMKATQFFEILQIMHKENPNRLQQITQRVRHFCTVIDPSWRPVDKDNDSVDTEAIQVWHLLPYFSNLETLELYGDYYYSQDAEEQVSEILGSPPKLRFLKLSGYMPPEVSAWLLKAGDTLERLELDMLDRPISTYLSNDPHFTPLPCEKINTDDGSVSESDYGSLADDMIIPRPLGNIFTDYGDYKLNLPKLKHLFLGHPAESCYTNDFATYSWSKRAESACYNDWLRILEASMKTLETLVLEQRPAADYIEGDGYSEDMWMDERAWSHASEILLEMVETVMSSETSQLCLKRVYLYGIVAGLEEDGTPFLDFPAGKFMQFLKDRGVECEARRGKWCFFDRQSGSVDWCPWNAAYEDEKEEEEEDMDEDKDEDAEPKAKWDTVLVKV
ncbi:hypothetical protein Focb16_v015768 [Fusarium oxysporum f. sp. cubense]|uniref:F-box domain-containing protein n=1 Tax=Fusarium oxysporum f. sp. cubense TaxID=61366 RepID=A0A559KZ07_FUSOC|nr:hypothetical protein Focb16_v015768 [Fusarium oxysporum f. sp. cubense]